MNDQEIIELYWDRSESAISETAKKYGNYLSFIANHILRNPPDAEECVNDTYYKAWETIPPTRPLNLQAYLGRTVRNFAIMMVRRRSAKKRGNDEVEIALSELQDCIPTVVSLEQKLEDQEILERIQAYLADQPEQKQILFVQRYWYVMPVKEIAARNGLSKTNVTSILHRMRKELKARLEKEGYMNGSRETV